MMPISDVQVSFDVHSANGATMVVPYVITVDAVKLSYDLKVIEAGRPRDDVMEIWTRRTRLPDDPRRTPGRARPRARGAACSSIRLVQLESAAG